MLYIYFMLDIVSSGDNVQETSNLYLWEEYEKCFAVFRISMCPSQSQTTKGSNYIHENSKNLNKIVIIPKYSSKLGYIICLYII